MTEPDYRFTLANERTFLAWLRTSLALLAAGVAVEQLGTGLDPAWARTGLSLGCLALSLVASAGGVLRWRAVDAAVRGDRGGDNLLGLPGLREVGRDERCPRDAEVVEGEH